MDITNFKSNIFTILLKHGICRAEMRPIGIKTLAYPPEVRAIVGRCFLPSMTNKFF